MEKVIELFNYLPLSFKTPKWLMKPIKLGRSITTVTALLKIMQRL